MGLINSEPHLTPMHTYYTISDDNQLLYLDSNAIGYACKFGAVYMICVTVIIVIPLQIILSIQMTRR